MPGTKRYRRLKGDSAYYPFGARTALRRRQRRQAALLWVCGLAALCLAAVLGCGSGCSAAASPNRPSRPCCRLRPKPPPPPNTPAPR